MKRRFNTENLINIHQYHTKLAKIIDEADWIGDYDRADTLREEYATISEHRDRGDVWYPAF